MSPFLLAAEWNPSPWYAFILAMLALVAAFIALLRKKGKDRVRPFIRFRLVNKSKRRVVLGSVSGFHDGGGGGGQALPGTSIAPPTLPAGTGNRTREWLDPVLGPDHLSSLRLLIQAEGDLSSQPMPYVQSATTDPNVPWHELREVEMVLDAVDDSKPHYGYTYTVTVTRYIPGLTASDYEYVSFSLDYPATP